MLRFLHLDQPKVYARWTVIIGGEKSPIKWAKKTTDHPVVNC